MRDFCDLRINIPDLVGEMGLVAKNGVVMKTEAIHPFFSEPAWPLAISNGNILHPRSSCGAYVGTARPR